jgi:putative membrane-bound dehydrogenase-like protein
MNLYPLRFTLTALPLAALCASATAAPAPLFDGKSLDQWESVSQLWRVEDGLITGGSLTENIKHNDFLATKRSYHNFDLKLKIRIRGGGGFINSGIQIRSVRVPNNSEMSGYQVDAGPGWWGKLYDESRRNKVIAASTKEKDIVASINPEDWVEYRIRCEGPRIQSWINGIEGLDYTEADPNIAQDGKIGIQVHSGGKALVQVKDISIEELPPTPNAPLWESVQAKSAEIQRLQNIRAEDKGPLTPEGEAASFILPEGFKAELVAAESDGIGKFITVDWDASGRMWTMTALEYPVDANENPQNAARLYETGGNDKVLVLNDWWSQKPSTPSTFADGLAIPLGILPGKDSVVVQYGPDLRRYIDSNGDGKADRFEVILTGFGIEDSHLFPHQFVRAPGGWIYAAQGLFNRSGVKRPEGKPFANGDQVIPFNQCRLARFKPDGSAWENLTRGPNNIWGFSVARNGETFLQEANDTGIPVAEYEFGVHYPGGTREPLKPYAPTLVKSFDSSIMGGTGLSGLALAEDRDGWPAPWGIRDVKDADAPKATRSFFLANPITNRIQHVTASRTGPEGNLVYQKQADFLVATDLRFRPVAVHFGPDGCLYIVDWYNKVISHNEVPRSHPDRDKTRGRIWRIRHTAQSHAAPVNLTKLAAKELVSQLDAPNARIASLAWGEIVDRNDPSVIPALKRLAADESARLGARVGAIWALEGLDALDQELALVLAKPSQPSAVRAEVARLAMPKLAANTADQLVTTSLSQADFRTKVGVLDGLIHRPQTTPKQVELTLDLGKDATIHSPRAAYDSAFLRYLARWTLEKDPVLLAEAISRPSVDPAARTFGLLALPQDRAAEQLVKTLPSMKRPLAPEEAAILVAASGSETVRVALGKLLTHPEQTIPTLAAIAAITPPADLQNMPATRTLLDQSVASAGNTIPPNTAIQLARAYRLPALEPTLKAALKTAPQADTAALIEALESVGTKDASLLQSYLTHADATVARAAATTLSAAGTVESFNALIGQWGSLPNATKKLVLDRLAGTKSTAKLVVDAAKSGTIPADDLDGGALDKILALLKDDTSVLEYAKGLKGLLQGVLSITESRERSYAKANAPFDGPFTAEGWVWLSGKVGNQHHLFGRRGGADMNFFAGRFRLWAGPGIGDVIEAKTPTKPENWTHVALTRDNSGALKLYMNGELDAVGKKPLTDALGALSIGDGNVVSGTVRYQEVRVWDRARSAEEIRGAYLANLSSSKPEGLTHRFAGDTWPQTVGKAVLSWTRDYPELLTPEQTKSLEEKFARMKALVSLEKGDKEKGRALFAGVCATCHQVQGAGGQIGPDLSGAGAMGIEALLHNLLTPNAAVESGYYVNTVELRSGEILTGRLMGETPIALTLRPVGGADRQIPRADIKKHSASRKSLMPDGLIEGLPDGMLQDLFSYLKSLR